MSRSSLLETSAISILDTSGIQLRYRAGIDTSDIVPVSSKEFFDIQVTIECRFTLKPVTTKFSGIFRWYKMGTLVRNALLKVTSFTPTMKIYWYFFSRNKRV